MANRETREVQLNFKAKGLGQTTAQVNKLKDTALVGATQATEQLNRQMTNLSQSSGLAGSTLNALGQGIGDVQYGFGAVANNISQVGSLFGMLVAKTGGVGTALKSLGQQLIGPAGVMFAFQMVIAGINYFTSASKKAEKDVNKLTNAIADNTSEMLLAKAIIDDANTTDETRAEIIKDLNDKYKDLNLKVDKNGNLTEESTLAIDKKIGSLERLARAESARAEMVKLTNQQLQAELEMNSKLKELGFETREDFEAFRDLRNAGGGPSTLEGGGRIQGQGQKILADFDKLIEEVGEKKATLIALIQSEGTGEDIVQNNRESGSKDRRDKVKSVSDLESSGLSTELPNSPLKSIEKLLGDYDLAIDLEVDKIKETETYKRSVRKKFADMELEDKKLQNEQMLAALGQGLGQAARLMTSREGKATAASKAISSASVLIDTYQSASKAYKTYAANPILAKAMAATAVIGGMARVKAINSVRVPHASGGGGLASPNIVAQSPDFNVIGRTSNDTNVLADAINAGNSQPVQAYVVESEITSQQQLNRTANNNSSI